MLAPRVKEEFSFRKPAVLVFLAGADQANCCAANYERIVFMDKAVIGLTKKHLMTLRIDRGTMTAKELARFGVKKNKPAIRVLDCEGVIQARFDTCVNARDVSKAMVACVKASKTKVKLSKKVQKILDKALAKFEAKDVREGAKLLRRARDVKGAPAAGAERASRLLAEVTKRGEEAVKDALALGDPKERFDVLLQLRHDYWDFDALVKQVRPALKALEEGEATQELIHNHKGDRLINEALAMIEKGGVMAGKGRSLLRKVRLEWKGLPPAKRAHEALGK